MSELKALVESIGNIIMMDIGSVYDYVKKGVKKYF